MNFRSRKWTVLLLVFLIILGSGIFIQFKVGSGVFWDNIKSFFLNSYYQNPFYIQSEVSISLVDSKLNLDFDILEDEKQIFQDFTQNWFGVREEIKSLKLDIDENLVRILLPILPAKLNLTVMSKTLEFKNYGLPGLKTALTGTDINFATGSGRLKVKYASPTQYQLNIENPEDIAIHATESGMMTTSSKIERLFKSLSQVATIELDVNGKNISGKIILK